MPTGAEFGAIGIIMSLALIIGLPILVFVFGFIWSALFAIFYNYIVTRVAKINLEFAAISGNLQRTQTHTSTSNRPCSGTCVSPLLGLVFGILSGNYAEFITNFVHVLHRSRINSSPHTTTWHLKIGSIKLNLE